MPDSHMLSIRGRPRLPEDHVLDQIEKIRRQNNWSVGTSVQRYVRNLPIFDMASSGEPNVRMADGRIITKKSAIKHLQKKHKEEKENINARLCAEESGQNRAKRILGMMFSSKRKIHWCAIKKSNFSKLISVAATPILPAEIKAFQVTCLKHAQSRREAGLPPQKFRIMPST